MPVYPVRPKAVQESPSSILNAKPTFRKTGPSTNKRKNKTGCPVSKAVVGTEIKLTAKLA
jgi:hypothetical protein